MNKYTFYWLDGKREVLDGESVAGAFRDAGYGAGAMSALDFTCNGEDDSYDWNGKKWIRKEIQGEILQ